MIECMVCGKKFKTITFSHLKKHNITIDDYKKMFPLSPLWSDETKEERSNRNKGKNNPMYGRTHSKETKDILSLKQKIWCIENGNQFYDKKHKKETIEYLRKIQTGKKANDDTRRKMSKSHKGLHYNIGKDNPSYGIPIEDFAPNSKGALLKKGIISPSSIHSKEAISSHEFIVYEYLNNDYSGYIYHNVLGDISFEYNIKDKKFRKFPDMVLFNENTILFFIEVNGLYWHTLERTKQEEESRMKMIYEKSGFPLLILWENEIDSGYYKEKINDFISNID